jgi:predicted branched-subunit amino acid permease
MAARPSTAADPLLAGARDILPLLAALAPFGVAIGATAAAAEGSALAGWAGSWLIYGGTAQLVTAQLHDSGAAVVAIAVAVLLANVRLSLFGAAMAVHWQGTSLRWRLFAGYLLVDPVYVVAAAHHAEVADPAGRRRHYLGAAVTMWVGWVAANGVGSLAGGNLPDFLGPALLLPLALVAMTLRVAVDRPGRIAAVTAAVVGVALHGLPMHSGLLVAGAAGIAAGLRAERSPR